MRGGGGPDVLAGGAFAPPYSVNARRVCTRNVQRQKCPPRFATSLPDAHCIYICGVSYREGCGSQRAMGRRDHELEGQENHFVLVAEKKDGE